MRRTVTVTPEQAAMLVNLKAPLDQAQREHDLVFTAILAGHGITTATGYTLSGQTLAVEVADEAEA